MLSNKRQKKVFFKCTESLVVSLAIINRLNELRKWSISGGNLIAWKCERIKASSQVSARVNRVVYDQALEREKINRCQCVKNK